MKLISKNRHAYHDYQIDKEYEVGIILKGHEVKSIKASHVNIKDSMVRLDNKELWIMNMDVPLYEKTSYALVPGYEPKGKRKLLITKKELAKVSSALDKSGTTIIPLEIFINKRGLIKLKIGIGKLMRKIEKKQVLKERDIKKQMDREIRHL
ncbi:MAG: SsrA-binding protein SmpB [Candidatus Absconditabacterales bacterium]